MKTTRPKEGSKPLLGKKRRAAPSALTRPEIRDSVARDRNKSWLRERAQENENLEDEEEDDDEDIDIDIDDLIRPSEAREITKAEVRSKEKERVEFRKAKDEETRLERKDQRTIETYLTDPLYLANAVLDRLKVADIDGALRFVRLSSTMKMQNVVSWNHCIDWQMSQGRTEAAFSLFNDMKKRGRMPDAHTYTVMLRGLASQAHRPAAVKRAVDIYNSIFAPNSQVEPSSIHTNAVIHVCARGGDMSSLWSVVSRMPERGRGSPDRLTYTTILNAIRENATQEAAKILDTDENEDTPRSDATKSLFEKAVADGRRVWEDVSFRWRRAELVIDEGLVFAYGKLLLGCGTERDIRQILVLVNTTMNIKIMGKEMAYDVSPPAPTSSPSLTSDSTTPEDHPLGAPITVTKAKERASEIPLSESSVYAVPGRKILSLLLDVFTAQRNLTHVGPAYWDLLTDPQGQYRIEPDAPNISAYLRVLRVQRASRKAYQLLSQKWPHNVAQRLYRRGPFIVAMSACMRDRNNPNVFETAGKLLKLMEEKMEERAVGMFDTDAALSDMHGGERKKALKDLRKHQSKLSKEELAELEKDKEGVESLSVEPTLLANFLELGMVTTSGWNEGVRGKDDGEVFERDPQKNHTMIAINRVQPLFPQLKRLMMNKANEFQFASPPSRKQNEQDPRSGSRVGHSIKDMTELLSRLISAYDRILEMQQRFQKSKRGGIDKRLIREYTTSSRECTIYMSRFGKFRDRPSRNSRDKLEEPADDDSIAVEEEKDNITPLIEQQIKAVLGEVDEEITERRDEKKGRSLMHVGPPQKVKIRSRNLKAERDGLIERAMERDMPKTDYGVLDNDLSVQLDPTEQERVALEQRERNLLVNSPRRSNRAPMIGDELDLEDDDEEVVEHNTRPIDHVPFKRDLDLSSSSIMSHPDVQKAWSTSHQKTSMQGSVKLKRVARSSPVRYEFGGASAKRLPILPPR